MKKLVVYYSLGGNTRDIARRIAKTLNAHIAEIHTVKAYPDDYDVLLGLGKQEVQSHYMPQIVPLSVDLSKYETILIGTPIWWSSFAPALHKFLSTTNWRGKKVYPFATYSETTGHVNSDLKKAIRNAQLAPVFGIKYDEGALVTPVPEIRAWLNTVK